MFRTNFSGHNKIWERHKKLGGPALECPAPWLGAWSFERTWRPKGMTVMARAMGATLTGTQKLPNKNLFVTWCFFNLYFAPHTTINCKAASTQRPYLTHK